MESEYEGWAILELLGHRRLAGKIRECTIAGQAMVAIVIPRKERAPVTQYYSGHAVYGITPCTEESAIAVAHSLHWSPPVQVYDLLERAAAVAGEEEDGSEPYNVVAVCEDCGCDVPTCGCT